MAKKSSSRVALLIVLIQLLLLVDERYAQSAKNCRCVEKHRCKAEGSTDVVVLPSTITPANVLTVAGDIDLRFDENHCERVEICCEEKDITNSRLTEHVAFDRCGIRNLNGIGYRLVGDKIGVSEYGEFPWTLMVLINQQVVEISKQVYLCAASLIAPNLALTAAHCVKQKEQYFVRAGEWDTNTDKERFQTQTREVAQVIIHEKYNQLHHNNIALLKLDKPFEADENIQTICLPPPDANFNGHDCFTGAWGKDKFEEGRLQNILRRVEVPVVPHDKCQGAFRSTRLGPFFVLDKSYMCAGGEENVDVCTGDGGAPLVCPIASGNDRYFQAGIVAWGIGCGQKGIPGAYTDVTKFVAWIYDKMAALGVDPTASKYSLL
ncbi:hypothetical protein quinque_008019 [Culex quinquefasciatus]